MLISRGVKVDKGVYKHFKNTARLSINPLCCNCLLLSDGTVVQLTDTQFHLQYLSGILSWDNIKLLRHVKDLATPFTLRMGDGGTYGQAGKAVLFYEDTEVDTVSFPAVSHFYKQKTSSGRPFAGNAVMQGQDWVAFQCLWPCEFAAGMKACQFCFSGGDFESAAKKGKPLPEAVSATDMAEIAGYALARDKVSNIQITGGSTFDGKAEAEHITAYLTAIKGLNVPGETLLYITPPSDTALTRLYFELGASRLACSLEVWDTARAGEITPGKLKFVGRERYLQILEYTAKKYGSGKAFSNFIIGLEGFDTLAEGAVWLAERGILPAASVWMPMGRPVMGSMKAPQLDYYKRVKELFAELYTKFKLEPPKSRGLNVCVERDIWNYAAS
jgi:hypothetical protein